MHGQELILFYDAALLFLSKLHSEVFSHALGKAASAGARGAGFLRHLAGATGSAPVMSSLSDFGHNDSSPGLLSLISSTQG